MTLGRIIMAVLAIWLVVGLLALVRFHAGGSAPGDGRGERIEFSP